MDYILPIIVIAVISLVQFLIKRAQETSQNESQNTESFEEAKRRIEEAKRLSREQAQTRSPANYGYERNYNERGVLKNVRPKQVQPQADNARNLEKLRSEMERQQAYMDKLAQAEKMLESSTSSRFIMDEHEADSNISEGEIFGEILKDHDEFKRAFVMSELISKPLSLR